MDKKALILVVDDNSECRAMIVWILKQHGFRTISAAGGREGIELAIEFQPRLVLMDLSMPGTNGYQATQSIHAHRRGRNIPVVAVSADCVDYRSVSWVLKAGFTACLGKPFEEEALVRIVTKVLATGVKRPASCKKSNKRMYAVAS